MRNIDKYIGNIETGPFGEGYCYRNDENYNNKVGICYIGENDMFELGQMAEDPEFDMTDKELLEMGYAYDYDALQGEVTDYFSDWKQYEIEDYLNELGCCEGDVVDIMYSNLYHQHPLTELQQMAC